MTDKEKDCDGCGGCSAGACGRSCSGCGSEPRGKLTDYDWLADIPAGECDLVEVQFKNTRKGIYRNSTHLPLEVGDMVAVEATPGHDIGQVTLTGPLVRLRLRRRSKNEGEIKRVFRKAKAADLEKYREARAREHETMIRARRIAEDLGLNMKIGDVEFQGDGNKAIFYYIADERVDFRQLIKVLAEKFKVRIEMKQIGARQEAGRIGGIGPCGRPLCCSSWMTNFVSVATGAARYQDISLNPQKLAGQCSKLKCCMMYEYDTYVDARKEFPRLREPLQTIDGEWFFVKNDVLAGTMTFSSSKDTLANLTTLPVARVKEILEQNRAGKKVDRLQHADDLPAAPEEPTYRSGSDEDSITRFDKTRRRKRGRNNRGDQQPHRQDRPHGNAAQSGERETAGEQRTDNRNRRNNDRYNDRNRHRNRNNGNARNNHSGNGSNGNGSNGNADGNK